jgi:hypothetical protein
MFTPLAQITIFMQTQNIILTPLKAKELLNRTTTLNRSLKRDMVRSYAKLMLSGDFHHTHQGIAIDVNHNVIDGQHRLHALVKAGETNPNVTIEMAVATGCNPNMFKFIDSGSIRTTGDILQADGVRQYGHRIGATLKLYYLYKEVPQEQWGKYNRRNGLQASPEDICKLNREKLYELNSLLPVISSSHRGFPHFSISSATCFSLIAMDKGWKATELEKFWGLIKSGANLDASSPLLSEVKGTGMNKDQLVINNFIKAYNLHVKGQKCSRFFITQSPPVGEMLNIIKRSSIVRPDILAVHDEERGLA